jgi:hypothetical protein
VTNPLRGPVTRGLVTKPAVFPELCPTPCMCPALRGETHAWVTCVTDRPQHRGARPPRPRCRPRCGRHWTPAGAIHRARASGPSSRLTKGPPRAHAGRRASAAGWRLRGRGRGWLGGWLRGRRASLRRGAGQGGSSCVRPSAAYGSKKSNASALAGPVSVRGRFVRHDDRARRRPLVFSRPGWRRPPEPTDTHSAAIGGARARTRGSGPAPVSAPFDRPALRPPRSCSRIHGGPRDLRRSHREYSGS